MTLPTPEQRASAIIEEFSALGDWLDRYRYVVAMGERLPPMAAAEKTDANRIPGCQFGLWVVSEHDAARGVLRLRVDSDAKITRGLAALILHVLDGQPPAVVAAAELDFLDTLGLRGQLSARRGEGLAAMIDEIRSRARGYCKPEQLDGRRGAAGTEPT
jgi:cysteine desulfuration protein SufE